MPMSRLRNVCLASFSLGLAQFGCHAPASVSTVDEAGAAAGAGGAANDAGVVANGFERIVVDTDFLCEGANAGDFDGDGVMDVVAGPYWYAGPGFTTRHAIYPAKPFDPHGYSDNFFAWVYDFNQDGRSDVLFVGFPGQGATWYENPGVLDGAWTPHVVFQGVDDESPAFTDLTGDGLPELVFANGGRVGYAAPDWNDPAAPWVFHAISAVIGLVPFTHGLGVGDVDGDGRSDVVISGAWWQEPASLAGDPAWTVHQQTFGPGGAQMFALDVDGDGDADVVTSWQAHGYGLSWFEHTQAGFTEHAFAPKAVDDTTPGPLIHEPHALAMADMNGDGLPDLVTGERFWGHVPAGDPPFNEPASLYWFELQRGSGGATFVPHLIDDASGVGTQVVAVDLDGDGHMDIVVANKKGAFVFLQKP